jgi:integral membrane protein
MNGYTINTALGRLRILAILEGISYILLGVTMPLKYFLGMPSPNYFVGMFHGILFILYCLLVIQNGFSYNWKIKLILLSLIASLIPFGTFYADIKWFKMAQINSL